MPPLPELPPREYVEDAVLHVVLPALVTAFVVTTALTLVLGRARGSLNSALGVAAGFGVGIWMRDVVSMVPGVSTWNRLPWAALAALWIGRIARLPEVTPTAGWALRAATAVATAWIVIPSPERAATDWLAPVLAAVILSLWALLEHLGSEPADGSIPLLSALAFFVGGIVLIHAGTAKFMDVAIIASAALASVGLVAWVSRADSAGVAPAVAVMLPGLLLMGYQQTESKVPWSAFALAGLAPLVLAETLPAARWPRIPLELLRVLLILIPLALAVTLAMEAGPLTFGNPHEDW